MHEKWAILLLRFSGFILFLFGALALITNVIQSIGQIDLIYLDLYLCTQIAPLVFVMAMGVALWLASRPLARLFTHDLKD
ncbi:MAG: hypothetical protein ACOY3I_02855 [Verrucomicrobiota bacterium]